MDLTMDYSFDMDKGLIIREYRQAKDKNEQIKILAELNGVHPEVITSFLMSEGVITGAVKKSRERVSSSGMPKPMQRFQGYQKRVFRLRKLQSV